MARTDPRPTNNSPLSRLRIERGLTQAQLAKLVGCYGKDISRWERGERTPGMESLMKLAQALRCTMDDLAQK